MTDGSSSYDARVMVIPHDGGVIGDDAGIIPDDAGIIGDDARIIFVDFPLCFGHSRMIPPSSGMTRASYDRRVIII